jgi:hypothetical protein
MLASGQVVRGGWRCQSGPRNGSEEQQMTGDDLISVLSMRRLKD